MPVFIWPFSVAAQNADRVVFRHLNKKDGLSQASVFASAQDSTGFLWFGTRDGLNRYDGFNFRIYRFDGTPRAPVGGDIRSLYVDPLTKELWVGTLSGLSRYDATSDAFSNYQHVSGSERSLPGNIVRCVYRDRRNRLWVGTSLGLALLDEETNAFYRHYPGGMTSGGKGNDIHFITEHPNGNLLLGTADGMYLLSEGQQASYQRIDEFTGLSLTGAVWDEHGMLFVGTDKSGVIRWSPGIGVTKRFAFDEASANSLSHNSVRTLTFTSSGDLWVGTFHGLNLLKAGETTFTRYYADQFDGGSLRDNSIRSLLVDDAGSLWVGTYYGGIHHLDERYNHFKNYRYDARVNSLSAKVVSSFAQEPSGNLWVGTEGGGLNYFEEANDQFRRYGPPAEEPGAVTGNNVKQLLLDGEELWVGNFRSGLTRLNVVTGAYRRYRHDAENPETIANDNVYGLRKSGDLLWILTYGGGLDVLNTADGSIRNYAFDPRDSLSIDSDLTRSILKSTTGEWWVGTEQGLNRVTTDQEGYPIRFKRILEDLKIYVIYEGQNGELWLGTFLNGLVRYDPQTETKRRYTTADGLPSNTVFGIIEADDGELWLSTGNGLSRFDPLGENFINYDSSNGLDNLEYNFNAYFRANDGAFLLGGINGFTRFYPQDMEANDYVPAVVFTGLWHKGREVAIGGEDGLLEQSVNETDRLVFGYNEARFTLGFAALDYFSPENNYYAYKLEGLDGDWTFATGVSEAAYTIQREGNYTFLLKAGNSDGVWSDQVRSITIVVRPPIWRSWWAYIVYLLLVALLFYAVIFFLRLRHKVQLQEIAKRQQDELMETKLRFFTNITHEFRTPLTLMLGPLHQLANKSEHSPDTNRKITMIERNAQRLLKLVNQVLTFRKLVADHEPMEFIRLPVATFLSDIFSSFQEQARQRNITYTMRDEAAGTEAWVDPAKLEKVFYNLLSNAFKFTPDGGTIEMGVVHRNDQLEIYVTDSGVGVDPALKDEIFERFYEKPIGKQTSANSSGIGLALSRQMVQLHHGRLYVEENKAGPQGARFVVELPPGSAQFSAHSSSSPTSREDLSEEIVVDEAQVGAAMLRNETDSKVSANDKETLLLVDDNPDIREYLSDIFQQDFRVLTATSGLAGLKVANETMPNLIISDVMMPEMDGLAFCAAVKTNLNISHIPVILLTARTAQPSRIQGLQTGADDYVTKPFNPEELRLRVTNLLANRRRFKESFSTVMNLEPSRIEVTSIDDQFLLDALAIAERHVQDPDYKVDTFARDLAVSRTLLFNKLKALTGQTPSKFLKTFRLKRAAQLLKDSDYRIRKIASMVGFRDKRYFNDCFKRHFGTTPGAFRKRELEK